MARPSMRATASAQHLGAHVVEQDGVDAGCQRLFELVQRIDLDLDLDHVADAGARARSIAAPDAARRGDMVVLDQNGVVEAEAVIDAAAGAHGVFLHRAQAGHRLAHADDARLVALHRLDQRRRGRGDAAEMAEEIERDALGREHAARGTVERRDAVARRDTVPSGRSIVTAIAGSIRRKAMRRGRARRRCRAGGRPARSRPRAAGTIASVVMSPARPRSSSRAARTSGSSISAGRGADGHLYASSMRSTARRARAATAGSIVTSCCIVSSARRILGRVIRFMCGQRLQGRTNSISGLLDGDVVAHRAFGHQHDPARPLAADIVDHRRRRAREIGFGHDLGRAFGMGEHDEAGMPVAELRGRPRR